MLPAFHKILGSVCLTILQSNSQQWTHWFVFCSLFRQTVTSVMHKHQSQRMDQYIIRVVSQQNVAPILNPPESLSSLRRRQYVEASCFLCEGCSWLFFFRTTSAGGLCTQKCATAASSSSARRDDTSNWSSHHHSRISVRAYAQP